MGTEKIINDDCSRSFPLRPIRILCVWIVTEEEVGKLSSR